MVMGIKQDWNIDFTANMEDRLELVAESQRDWKDLLKSFFIYFSAYLGID